MEEGKKKMRPRVGEEEGSHFCEGGEGERDHEEKTGNGSRRLDPGCRGRKLPCNQEHARKNTGAKFTERGGGGGGGGLKHRSTVGGRMRHGVKRLRGKNAQRKVLLWGGEKTVSR